MPNLNINLILKSQRAYRLRIFRKLSSWGRGFEPDWGLYFFPIILLPKKFSRLLVYGQLLLTHFGSDLEGFKILKIAHFLTF